MMTFADLLTTPAVISTVADGATDSWGDVTRGVATSATTVCYLEQTAETESNSDRAAGSVTALLVVPAGTTISARSTVTVAGRVWEVVGEPAERARPGDDTHHIEATIRTTGATA